MTIWKTWLHCRVSAGKTSVLSSYTSLTVFMDMFFFYFCCQSTEQVSKTGLIDGYKCCLLTKAISNFCAAPPRRWLNHHFMITKSAITNINTAYWAQLCFFKDVFGIFSFIRQLTVQRQTGNEWWKHEKRSSKRLCCYMVNVLVTTWSPGCLKSCFLGIVFSNLTGLVWTK